LPVFRPSPLVRWPLLVLSGMFVFVIAALVFCAWLFVSLGEPLPWALLTVGGGVCALFIALNTTVAAMRLEISENRVVLRVGPWRRAVALEEAVVVVEMGQDGVVAARVVPSSGGRTLWLNAAWFREFDAALAELERLAVARGGAVDVRRR
jgi:hypothetical protein